MRHTLLYYIRNMAASLFVMLVVSLLPLQSRAKSLTDMLCSMPDTLLPYIAPDARIGLVDNLQAKTVFDTNATLQTLSASRIKLTVDSIVTVEMMRLPYIASDSVYCVLRTVCLPQHDTEVTLYDSQWRELQPIDIKGKTLNDACRQLTSKPDTMTQERYEELLSKITFLTVEATTISDDEIALTPSVPLLFKDEDEAMKAILLQKNAKWNKKTFK